MCIYAVWRIMRCICTIDVQIYTALIHSYIHTYIRTNVTFLYEETHSSTLTSHVHTRHVWAWPRHILHVYVIRSTCAQGAACHEHAQYDDVM